ncbi:MAG: hypothetical protein LPJ89_06370 [Hymenobacteraceae bacterium]|nr:hypothetical protein [Hymenobacteraceae bacterium]MDX5395080.1 hypothetical protein [Hymenobacteraceae bacterium]MDX5443395.1 hypothetical protein [Hymenobacteraceae bacterium]MDX5511118.1 hypothetical protein [Hymenobacteraceae bacterium]
MDDRLDVIFEGLKQKSTTKQTIYRNTCITFEKLKRISAELVEELSNRISPVDSHVVIEFRNISDFEFHIKFSGDLLIFIMHSNIITFPETHEFMKTPYVEGDFRRRFFGNIMAYNFMADTLKYHRMDDYGYLLGRLLVNIENHFYLQSVKQLDLVRHDMEHNVIDDEILRILVESAMIAAINNDLVAPKLSEIKKITYKEKVENQQLSGGRKVGFIFSFDKV